MANTTGSVEIVNRNNGTSDGLVVNTPNVAELPAALTTLRGLTNFSAVKPVPTVQREVGTFTYRQEGDAFVRDFNVELVEAPVADAMWTAQTPDGNTVEVLFRETRTVTPDQMEAARALAEIQASRM